MFIWTYLKDKAMLSFIIAGLLQLTFSCSKENLNHVSPPPTTDTTDTVTTIPVDTTLSYLALGDSYTIGQSVPADQNYPNQTTVLLKDSGLNFTSPEIIATTGWTTGDLLNAIAAKTIPSPPYDLVTLLIGVNNQYQGRSRAEYKDQFITLLKKSIAYAGNKPAHVVVLSIPDYAVSPYGQSTGNANNISRQIDSFNIINKEVSDSLHIHYLNVTDESRQALGDTSLFASDGLHFSGKEYALWSSQLAAIVREIFK